MTLCRSFGYSKQAYYRSQRFGSCQERECYLVGLVEELRHDLPRLGGVKLWKLLNENGVRVGRDELFRLLGRHGLLVKRRKRRAVTTGDGCLFPAHHGLACASHPGQRRSLARPVPCGMPSGGRCACRLGPPFRPGLPVLQRTVRLYLVPQGDKNKHDAGRLAV